MASFALCDQGLHLGLDTDLTNRTSFALAPFLSTLKMKTPLLVVAKTLKHNKRQKRPREFHCPQNYPQSNKTNWRDQAAPAQPCEPVSPSLSKVVGGQRQRHLVLNASSVCSLLPCRTAGEESPAFIPSLPPHGLVTPIYF